MSRWSVWDWFGYGCLGITAFGAAFSQLWRETPGLFEWLPALFSSPHAAYVPAILFAIGSVVLIFRAAGLLGPPTVPEKALFGKWPDPYSPEVIFDKKFINERVVLDNRRYERCEFSNVTFVYNGTTAVQLNNSRFIGRIQFGSDNPAVLGAIILLYSLGGLKDSFAVEIDPKCGTVQPVASRQI